MAHPAEKPSAYADLRAADAEGDRTHELVDGELRRKASPRPTHSWSQRRLGTVLDPVEGGGGADDGPGWWILTEPDVVFSDQRVLVPDLAGWRRDRLPGLPDAPIHLRPDWVCELLSPGHIAYDRQAKSRIYAEEGVPWYWLLHPDERFVEVRHFVDGRWVIEGIWSHGEHVLPPFSIPIQVDRLFYRREGEPPMAHEPRAASYG